MISLIKVLGMLKHRIFLPSGGLSKPRQDFEWAVSCIGRHKVASSTQQEMVLSPLMVLY
jgi:hypothetical protein